MQLWITYRYMRHGTQIVYFMWFDFRNDVEEIGGIRQITVMQEQANTRLLL